MLPLSWRRLADSKSNSSTRLPRSTTTRVSSGWVASISILLAIDVSLGGARDSARPVHELRSRWRGTTQRAARLLGGDRRRPRSTGQANASLGLSAIQETFVANDRRHGAFDP